MAFALRGVSGIFLRWSGGSRDFIRISRVRKQHEIPVALSNICVTYVGKKVILILYLSGNCNYLSGDCIRSFM